MAYILPRAFIVLIGWGITCGLIANLSANFDPMIFYVAGASWVTVGLFGFGYLYRLRRARDQ
ncbi:MAG: hypothetical protein WBF58_18700 [Xanthobacteraceae bacterium]